MDQIHNSLTTVDFPGYDLIKRVQNIGKPENFFVGLPDTEYLPLPRNVLMFCERELTQLLRDVTHQRYMLIINLEKEVTIMLDGLMLRLSPGQAIFVYPFQVHRYLIQEDGCLTWLFITFEMPESDALRTMKDRTVDVPSDLWPYVDSIIAEYQMCRSSGHATSEVPVLLSYILLRLLRQCRDMSPPGCKAQPAIGSHRIVQRASRFIATHMAEPMTVCDIATALSVSAGYLRNCFRQVLKTNVQAYIRRTRVFAACSLLSRSESNITQIADRCGFGSVYAFSRAFKREIGMPPTAYRKHLWEDGNVIPSSLPGIR